MENDDQNGALPYVLELLEQGIPPNIIISFCIIINPKALEMVLSEFGYANTFPKLEKRNPVMVFHPDSLTQNEKNYINLWLEIVFVIITQEVSSLMTRRFIEQLQGSKRNAVTRSLTQFLSMFFQSVSIEPTQALESYARFIVDQMERKIRQIDLEDIDTGMKIRL